MIIVEKPILSAMVLGTQYKKCCNCLLKNQMNLIPCLKTASLMFCSIECRDEVYSKFNQKDFDCLISVDSLGAFKRIFLTFLHTFGGQENLIKFAVENNITKWNRTVFDYDFSNPNSTNYNRNALMSIFSYFPQAHYDGLQEYRRKIVEKVTHGHHRILEEFLSHVGNN
jgi:hypothetical protein